jgi:hypothetical protein
MHCDLCNTEFEPPYELAGTLCHKCAGPKRIQVWRSRTLLVQVFGATGDAPCIRMSVNRTELDDTGRFRDGLTWDELMEAKRQAGFGDFWATEIYPPDGETVNVSNMRHLWLTTEAPNYAWRKRK